MATPVADDDVKYPTCFEQFDKVGVTDEYMAKTFRALTKATKRQPAFNKDITPGVIPCGICNGRPSKPKCKACKGKGFLKINPWSYSRPMPDNDIRVKVQDMWHKLKGDYAPNVIEVEGLKDIADRLQDALEKKARE